MPSLVLMLVVCAPVDREVDTIVVCPQEFRQALVPWIEHRRAGGHRLALVSNLLSAPKLRTEVRRIAAAAPVRFLVLVGDADPAMASSAQVRKRSVPTHYARAVVNLKWGSEPEIASDNWYADLDDDRLPDLAVGRLPVDTPEELERLVAKILAYERSVDFGRWRSQLHFVAGTGGFGAVADTVLEAAAKTLIAEGVPPGFDATMTYANWQSPYCPDPRTFRKVALERLNEGSLFWIYIGHGDQRAVDAVQVPGAAYPILSSRDAALLACRHGAPIACFLACYTGAFDQQHDCLAEEVLRAPGGPVAVIASSRVSMPYAMTVMGSELMHQAFVARLSTVGEIFLAAKRGMMQSQGADGHRAAIEATAQTFQAAGDLEAERREHLDLFNLLGDPLVCVPHPQQATLDVKPSTTAGDQVTIAGSSPVAGICTLELVVRHGRLTFQPPRRASFDPTALAEYGETYKRANQPRLASTQFETTSGRFTSELLVPASVRGGCHVRVFVEGSDGCAVGSADIRVEAPPGAEGPAASGAVGRSSTPPR
jgi:hypothetical protein